MSLRKHTKELKRKLKNKPFVIIAYSNFTGPQLYC